MPRLGENRASNRLILREPAKAPSAASVVRMLQLSRQLEGLWLLLAAGGAAGIWALTSGSPQ